MTNNDGTCIVIAVPSSGAGGLDSERSEHFGRSDNFTLAGVENGVVTRVWVVDNACDGGCLGPVNLLASQGVTHVLAWGIGGRPLAGFQDAGIDVYCETETPSVREAVSAFLAGTVGSMDPSSACGCH